MSETKTIRIRATGADFYFRPQSSHNQFHFPAGEIVEYPPAFAYAVLAAAGGAVEEVRDEPTPVKKASKAADTAPVAE